MYETAGSVVPLFGYLNFNIFTTAVNRSVVHLNDVLTLSAVGLVDCPLHMVNCLLVGNDAGNLKECGLEDSVSSSTQTDFSGNLCGVDQKEAKLFSNYLFLYKIGNPIESLLGIP